MNNMRKKICVVTGTRAEYGLLFWVLKAMKHEKSIDLKIVVTGMHLSPEFGLTFKEIEKDGFKIDKKVDILMSSDSSVGISKSIGLGIMSFSELFMEINPDLLFVVGDRYEIFSAVSAAMICKIPVAHCHGGEATSGLIDEPIRHSITKMSHFHFTSTSVYQQRVIQLGENPKNVFNVGALGIESINKLNFLSKKELEKQMNFKLDGKFNVLVTFHPVTLEDSSSKNQMNEILMALNCFPDSKIIFTKANADTDGRIINLLIDEYVKNHQNSISFASLGQLKYLSLLNYVDLVLGNSSSGLLEVPSFQIPTINIGDRQSNRLRSESVIDCANKKKNIKEAILYSQTEEFKLICKKTKSPYGEKNSSTAILDIIKDINLKQKESILKKTFYDLK